MSDWTVHQNDQSKNVHQAHCETPESLLSEFRHQAQSKQKSSQLFLLLYINDVTKTSDANFLFLRTFRALLET